MSRWVDCTSQCLARRNLLGHRLRRGLLIRGCIQTSAGCQPDVLLRASNGWHVHVLGANHMQQAAHIGRYILDRRPAAVFTETSLTPEQTAMPGGTVSCSSPVQGPAAFWVRMFCAVGAELEQQGSAAFAPGGVWHSLQQNYHGEQLAYIAAFALNRPLVFVDRPKDVTYKRLWALPSLVELDHAFTQQAVQNYTNILEQCGGSGGGGTPSNAKRGSAAASDSVVDRILLQEREAIMCHVIDSWCTRLELEGDSSQNKEVVAVLGAAHVPGVQALWESGGWRSLVGSADVNQSPLMTAPSPPPMSGHDMAVRRGLLESMFRLSVPEMVVASMSRTLAPIPAEFEDVHYAVRAIYGSTRMLLATLPEDMLPQICGGFECNMWDVLKRLRAVRPIHGGPGYDWSVLEELQMLYLEIEGEEEGEEA